MLRQRHVAVVVWSDLSASRSTTRGAAVVKSSPGTLPQKTSRNVTLITPFNLKILITNYSGHTENLFNQNFFAVSHRGLVFLLSCDAPKGILGNLPRKVHTSQLRCILAKVGGSGWSKLTSGDLVPTWSDVNLRIGFVLWQRLMTCHKNASTGKSAYWETAIVFASVAMSAYNKQRWAWGV